MGGGWKNVASGYNSFIGGGGAQTSDSNGGNVASGSWSAVLGGSFNTAKGMCVVAGPCTVSLEVQAAANVFVSFAFGHSGDESCQVICTTGNVGPVPLPRLMQSLHLTYGVCSRVSLARE